jgi:hypothetical protein
MQKVMRTVLQAVKPSPRRGALDEDKKAMVIVLVGQGASRREAAELVKCHHTTIGRTAARDAAFGAKLAQVESAAHLEAGDMIRRAGSDPKYWRAAAWMLERRNPEDYAKRDPTTFTGDQVMSLLASFFHEAKSLVQQEKAAEFEELFEDVLDEIEDKSGPVKREEESKEADSENGHLDQEKPSRNGHHTTNGATDAPASSNGITRAEHNGHDDADEPFEGESDESLIEPGDEIELADDDVPPELARRRRELDAEVLAHLQGHANAPPSRRAREILRDFHRRFVHHPRHRVAAALAKDALRKVFSVNELHQQSTSCTAAPNTEGRCTNGVMHAGGEPSGMGDER